MNASMAVCFCKQLNFIQKTILLRFLQNLVNPAPFIYAIVPDNNAIIEKTILRCLH